jgi:hypothetical protein
VQQSDKSRPVLITHTLTYDEIMSLPSGRVLDSLIQEYVFGDNPRWFVSKTGVTKYHKDYIDSCQEYLPYFSSTFSGKQDIFWIFRNFGRRYQFLLEGEKCWATFSHVPAECKEKSKLWAYGDNPSLAVCRAALLALSEENQEEISTWN